LNFNTKSFKEFKQVNNLSTEEAFNILLNELEKLKKEVKDDAA
jgi:hypothetical protein